MQNIQINEYNDSFNFDLVLRLNIIIGLGIIINGENKTLEWNENILS